MGGGVATPDAAFIVHGRRGADTPPGSHAWGFAADQDTIETAHWHFPYFQGDIVWGGNGSGPADAAVIRTSIQQIGLGEPLVSAASLQALKYPGGYNGIVFDQAATLGQLPVVTAPPVGSNSSGALSEDIDLWAYTYGTTSRPGIRVREFISGDDVNAPYWRFDDPYNMQSGTGVAGDLPGDFKFQYASTVIRRVSTGEGVVGIYGSGWVHIPDDDPRGSRVFPPFQGTAGGPDGGPLLTVHDREIDILFVPSAVRPGAILETGQMFRLAGPIMPTLPSMVEYRVIAPDGSVRDFAGRANAIGYYYQPEDEFLLDQAGLWTVEMLVTHDGETSAGPVEPPFPTGGPLTPEAGAFRFVVRDTSGPSMVVVTDLVTLAPWQWSFFAFGARFAAELPDGFEAENARVIVTMPGIVLVDEEIEPVRGWLNWDLHAFDLAEKALNFDAEQGFYDTVTVTFFAEDASGESTAGTIVTHGARLPMVPPGGDQVA